MANSKLCPSCNSSRISVFYEVLDIYSDEEHPYMMEIVEMTRNLLKSYRDQEWEKSISLCNKIFELRENDNLAKLYLERCEYLQENSPGSDWNGVWVMQDK